MTTLGSPYDYFLTDAFGFYWTEGLRGLGWAADAVPTLKGGSTVGIPSPPAIWVKTAESGRRIIVPSIEEAEELQGFERGWTEQSELPQSNGPRWRLVGNAVTVGVSEWLGHRLLAPGSHDRAEGSLVPDGRWPTAAWGAKRRVYRVTSPCRPVRAPYKHLLHDRGSPLPAKALSNRAAAGFYSRMQRAKLRFHDQFREDIADHVRATN